MNPLTRYYIHQAGGGQEVLLYVKSIHPAPSILASHNEALLAGYPARYNFTRVELKPFAFSGGSQFLTINNAVLGSYPSVCYSPW